jgi:hypothetical protein
MSGMECGWVAVCAKFLYLSCTGKKIRDQRGSRKCIESVNPRRSLQTLNPKSATKTLKYWLDGCSYDPIMGPLNREVILFFKLCSHKKKYLFWCGFCHFNN